jgi:hypothetical protein
MDQNATVTTGEIRAAWSEIQEGKNPFTDRQKSSATVRRLPDYRGAVASPWIGASGAEIQDRLQNGYYVDAADVTIPGGAVEIASPAMDLNEEEGNLLVSAVLAGDDFYRVRWDDLPARRGLKIRACIGMAAGASAETIGAYMTWILKVIDAAERSGVAPDVELWIGTKKGFLSGHDRLTVTIPLVKAGELVDAVAWRAFLTPGAFRSLGFVALALGADKVKRGLNSGMGAPTNRGWAVDYSNEVLAIECPASASSFPADLMDRMLGETEAGL